MRLAWFSPLPPTRTGVAACSAELVAALRAEHEIDVFTAADGRGSLSAHHFLPRHRQAPYDLTVYQLGNSAHHEYVWPYLFRYPGMVVLHDAHVHHARAAALLRSRRPDAYRAEFGANHPGLDPGLAELAVAGFDNHLHYSAPMTRLIAEASRLTLVHTTALADELRQQAPGAAIEAIRLGHGVMPSATQAAEARERIRQARGIPPDAVLFSVFGGLSPEKRIAQVLEAFAALLPYAPHARLLLAGAPARHYDVAEAVRRRGLDALVTITGYIDDDDELTDTIAAADVALSLRWPTAREVSGPWLRALAAGVPTITTHLTHMAHVPSLDPRTWEPNAPQGADAAPVTVAIDILDEDHSLRLAMRRLAADAGLRGTLAAAGRAYWQREHAPGVMVEDYGRAIDGASARPAPRAVELPAHLLADGTAVLDRILADVGVRQTIWSKL